MNREEYYLKEIEKIIDDYRYYREEYTSTQDMIEEICLVPTDDMKPHEISCLLDVLKESLIRLGVLSKRTRIDELSDIDLSDCTERDLRYMLGSIIDKLINVASEKEAFE